jgi:hypothetical protein
LIRASVAVVAVAALLLAGCGGDSEGSNDKSSGTTATEKTATETTPTATATTPTGTNTTKTTQTSTGENQPGGGGDEEPARTQALFTGNGGRIRPTVIRVPSFIAIRVVLSSGDGGSYALRFKGRLVQVSGSKRSASADFAGLRPGKVLAGTAADGGNAVRVEATAEPGP